MKFGARMNRDQEESKPVAVASKFFDEQVGSKPIPLTFGDKKDFYNGLAKLIGKPDEMLWAGMNREHMEGEDAPLEFVTQNFGITTRSDIEWLFVNDPSEESLAKLGIAQWPKETKLMGDDASESLMRKPMGPKDFHAVHARVWHGARLPVHSVHR